MVLMLLTPRLAKPPPPPRPRPRLLPESVQPAIWIALVVSFSARYWIGRALENRQFRVWVNSKILIETNKKKVEERGSAGLRTYRSSEPRIDRSDPSRNSGEHRSLLLLLLLPLLWPAAPPPPLSPPPTGMRCVRIRLEI